jgi:hypothetical protein
MTKGVNQASGIFAMNEIAKVVKSLSSDPDLNLKEKIQYDVMYLFTPGSFNDYEVTNQFIQTMNQGALERIKFVICLDQLGHKGNLTVHVSNVNAEQEVFAKSIFKTLKLSAQLNKKPISFNKKFTPGKFYEWEHLRFAENNIISFTITSLQPTNPATKSFNNKFEKFSLYDDASNFDMDSFKQNVEVISEFIVRVLFGIEFQEEKYVPTLQYSNITDKIDYIEKNARIPVQVIKESPITTEIKKWLREFMDIK